MGGKVQADDIRIARTLLGRLGLSVFADEGISEKGRKLSRHDELERMVMRD